MSEKKYLNQVGQVLESKNGNLRIELNGHQLKKLISLLTEYGKKHYKDKSEDELKKADYSKGANKFVMFLGKPSEKAPSFVKNDLYIVLDES
jgi:hypothetical protein